MGDTDRRRAVAALLVAAGMAAAPAVAVPSARPAGPGYSAGASLLGQWGGPNINLSLDALSGKIEYDCGAGTIDGPVRPDANGRFTVAGRQEPAVAGRVTMSGQPRLLPVMYRGRLVGNTLELNVRAAGEAKPRAYRLTRGKLVKLVRCL